MFDVKMDNIAYGVILAAGEGRRMRPLTAYYAKITLPILDKPLLIHHLEIMKIAGIQKVFIVVSNDNYVLVQECIARYCQSGGKITCEPVIQEALEGTGHALLILEKKLAGKRFLLLLGDEYYHDVDAFNRLSANRNDSRIIGVVEYEDVDRITAGCNVQMEGDCVIRLVEKPAQGQIRGRWCWDGSVVLDATIFETLHELQDSNPSHGKDSLCIVKAMQRLIEKKQSLATLKKKCTNINITTDLDYIEASLIEIRKKYGNEKLVNLFKKYLPL